MRKRRGRCSRTDDDVPRGIRAAAAVPGDGRRARRRRGRLLRTAGDRARAPWRSAASGDTSRRPERGVAAR
ncbi:MAG: hypothetical protein ACK56I_15625, partial [bacterium]